MKNSNSDLQNRPAYRALARIALRAYDPSQQEQPSNDFIAEWENPLAILLEAASQGIGHVSADNILAEAPASQLPTHLMHLENNFLMLPRIAAAWKNIRDWVNAATLTHKQSHTDDDISNALQSMMPPFQKHADDGTLIFDNAHQRLAVATFIDQQFGVLTGGPGTGKTTTAAALLALHKRLDPTLEHNDILVCAPTGKAANRLQQSLHASCNSLHLDDTEKTFLQKTHPVTIQRALGWVRKTPEEGGPFRYGKNNPLAHRIVLMDEASMCDVELMSALINALSEHCILILLGDRDQLDSVEAGGVLAELVIQGAAGTLDADRCQQLAQRCDSKSEHITNWRTEALPQAPQTNSERPGSVIGLRYSWRAAEAPWVLALAETIRPGTKRNFHDITNCLQKYPASEQLTLFKKQQPLYARCKEYWSAFHQRSAQWTIAEGQIENHVNDALMEFQLLCTTNEQVRTANAMGCALAWGAHAHADAHNSHNALPHGCPLLVERNLHHLNLFNGDIGIAIGDGPGLPARWVIFPNRSDAIPLAELPQHRAAYGLTIHKSQGSEWKNIAIELPHAASELLDRNLLYTAITRSSGSVSLYGSKSTLTQLLQE
ncbi:MAG: AAA family ATPase [Planctomycetes bacterium]|nr:AAA family ATPase [Planctomycetota bacterium]